MYLLKLAERTREHQSSNRIPQSGRTMRIQLSALIALGDVHARQVADTGDLYEVGRLDEGDACDGAVGNQPRAVAVLHAPGDLDLLRVTNLGVLAGRRGREEAEVVYGVDCNKKLYMLGSASTGIGQDAKRTVRVLAVGRLVGGGSAFVGSVLALLAVGGRVGRQVRRCRPELVNRVIVLKLKRYQCSAERGRRIPRTGRPGQSSWRA